MEKIAHIRELLANRITAAGWSSRFTASGDLAVWHSNGDDSLVIVVASSFWQVQWYDMDDEPMSTKPLDDAIPADCEDIERIAAAVLRRLQADDPICAKCGYQGHHAEECDVESPYR